MIKCSEFGAGPVAFFFFLKESRAEPWMGALGNRLTEAFCPLTFGVHV